MDSPVAANIFGIVGVILWSVQLLPQIRWNYVRKSTEGVSIVCFTSWYLGGLVLAPYLVATDKAPPLVVQIVVFSLLVLVILFQHFYYDRKKDLKMLMAVLFFIIGASVGITYGLYRLMKGYKEEEFKISVVITVLSAIFMAGGFIPAVYEIVRAQSAEGLSRIFVAMDFLGGSSSILSLVFIVPFDYLASVSYAIVPCFEGTIFIMSFYYGTQVKTANIQYDTDHVFNRNRSRSARTRSDIEIGSSKMEKLKEKETTTTTTTVTLSQP
ncbi:hypothetical protein PPL_08000 [Heterostelium album PN500]|uniref:Uncharacterized protein n=1 Tax=Heterostelium pallidum (strain ATCC 26659 / Pp 5 / PN500) TaxID=670386 RepID=D3BHJ7_HETP5|nr:hypothetical protein PPL_08000 [Heterostelium album PN500]EFA79174.1 hypothetical protein PPL_08000 [Heterostelium album PN500]|eukprot:XP_020431295.1 hypothetical protein PPL_08000 [Heterostelium album PN500]